MIHKLRSIVTAYFHVTIPECDKEEFKNSINRINLVRAKATSFTFILLEIMILIITFVVKKNILHQAVNHCYIAMYFIMLCVMSLYFYIFSIIEKKHLKNKYLVQISGFTFSGFILFWCAVISLLDQMSSGQIIVYTVAILAIAVTPVLEPKTILMIYLSCHTFFITALVVSWNNIDYAFANSINSTTFIIVSLAIAFMRYRNRQEDFITKKAFQKKSEDLEKVNRELANVVHKLAEANRQLEKLTQTDSLTGIFNRSVFDKEIEVQWNRCKYRKEHLSLIMIDIDLFKSFNDTYGHPAGDECLKKVAAALTSCVEHPSHIVTRYGGEEFAILLPYIKQENALVLAEAMRNKVEALQIPNACSPVSKYVTISLGVFSVIPSNQTCIYDFIDTADKALYEAKRESRNKIIVA